MFFSLRRLLCCLVLLLPALALAASVEFNIPAQTANQALLAFSRQAQVEVLFSFDELRVISTNELKGNYEPEQALAILLRNTGYLARRNARGKFVVARNQNPTGSLEGRLLTVTGAPARGAGVALVGTRLRVRADAEGNFLFPAIPPGEYRLVAGGSTFRPLERDGLVIEADRTLSLPPLQFSDEGREGVTELDPYTVRDKNVRLLIGEGVGGAPRRAAGNLDLPRTEDNALPFTIFTRDQIDRSGVVQLNEFFQRELIDGSASQPPEQNAASGSFVTGSANLGLRGYGADQTVVLVNGRRLPETFTDHIGEMGAPDVNIVPLMLVQQVEVLPVSASALYSGNAVGGVINIVLRPDTVGTELRTTYTNAFGRFDAPQSSVSLQHSLQALDGKLKLRLNATLTRTEPAVESELHHQGNRIARTTGTEPRATPNVVSSDGTPLFPGGTSPFTSIAPGAISAGGFSAFQGRQGVLSTSLFDTPGGLAASFDSLDYPYGRRQRRMAWYGSALYDVRPWLQLGLDATYARSVVNRGYEILQGTLHVPASLTAINPFDKDLDVTLNEFPAQLGQDYNEAHIDSYSLVGAALVKLPGNWQLSLDGQYARNVGRYRGIVGVNRSVWQQLVNEGVYNPLRDTQTHFAPKEFYDRALVYYGGPGRFVKLGDFETFEGTIRATNEALALPMGESTVNLGTDYRLTRLNPYLAEPRRADGTPDPEIVQWSGRTLERISVFGEVQAPLVPTTWLPRLIRGIETDSAVRYIISTQDNETNFAPTVGLKMDFAGGLGVRGSFTTSNRFPSPVMSRQVSAGAGDGSGTDLVQIIDPVRQEIYDVESRVVINENVRPESAITQTAGLIFQRGKDHRFRMSVDFADTTKTDEIKALNADEVLALEPVFPNRVIRNTPAPGPGPPRVTTVLTGIVNVARRHSQNWNTALDYTWNGFAGGTLDLRGRWVWFQRYDQQFSSNLPEVDELNSPDAVGIDLLRHRLTFGAGWSNRNIGFGIDAHYFGSRRLPEKNWALQGSDRIKAYWQLDAYVRSELTRWLPRPWQSKRFKLQAQLRVNNLSNFEFPKYLGDALGTSLRPYGDWRGRVYSLSLNAAY